MARFTSPREGFVPLCGTRPSVLRGPRVVCPKRVRPARRFSRRAQIVALTWEEVKTSTMLVNVYSITDKEGYPILQPMYGHERLVGSLYFLSCEQAMLTRKSLTDSGAEFGQGAQVAVIPFHVAFEKVIADPIPTEDTDDEGREVYLIFRFVPDLGELQVAKTMMEKDGVDTENLPEVPVFYSAKEADKAGTVFLSHEDCIKNIQETESKQDAGMESVVLADLPELLTEANQVAVVPSTYNKMFVDQVFSEAGMEGFGNDSQGGNVEH
ncbi:hypothetical protein NDN08_001200 [Rhodosorus marinus]|uniref:Uncharacterized protein n=1 Tax=Rhodosorus marinus TaxID=101924 RepID=A0AAV8UTT2_9RHOD|nr:hypothetical protein NDN08_001200 [Rhodosorus marinus]